MNRNQVNLQETTCRHKQRLICFSEFSLQLSRRRSADLMPGPLDPGQHLSNYWIPAQGLVFPIHSGPPTKTPRVCLSLLRHPNFPFLRRLPRSPRKFPTHRSAGFVNVVSFYIYSQGSVTQAVYVRVSTLFYLVGWSCTWGETFSGVLRLRSWVAPLCRRPWASRRRICPLNLCEVTQGFSPPPPLFGWEQWPVAYHVESTITCDGDWAAEMV